MTVHNLVNSVDISIRQFSQSVGSLGGQAWIVGGAVRDVIAQAPTKDIDIEVTGLSQSELENLPGFRVEPAGERFGVWLVNWHGGGDMFEVALPQTRERFGPGHGDETAVIDTSLTIDKSLARRDFTMNAMAVSVETGQLVDPFNGQADIQDGILRAVNTVNFGHDPLRVLRGMQFCARFDLVADTLTVASAFDHMDGFDTLSPDRVRIEWLKWASARFPAAGIRFLRATGWTACFPLLEGINGLEQDARWHPEGDVLEHTIQALEQVGSDPIVTWAVLLHDIGKASTTVFEGDKMRNGEWDSITSPGHAEVGASEVVNFFRSAGFDINDRTPDWVQAVEAIVATHMRTASWGVEVSARAVRRLARDLAPATVRQWAIVCMADTMGRGQASHVDDIVVTVAEIAGRQAIIDSAPEPIVMGRHLVDAGFSPGPHMGDIIRAAAEEHIDQPFADVDEAMAWVTATFEVC